nr:hypothetical protein [Micromonospora sp. DSM 115978]
MPFLAAAVVAPVLVSCGGDDDSDSGTATLNWYVFDEPSGAFAAAAAECSTQSGGEYRIEVNLLPSDADGQRQQMVRRLAAEDSSMDILARDVTWPAA